MLVHQAVKHRVPPSPSSFPLVVSSPPYTCISSLLFLIILLHLHPLLCKAERGTAQYAKDCGGMLSWEGRQTLTGQFHCALPPQQSVHRGLIWLSHSLSLFALCSTTSSNSKASHSLCFFISFSLLCPYRLSRQCMGNCKGISVLEG